MKCGRTLLGIAGLAAMLSAGTLDGIDLLPDPSLKGWTRIPIPAISGVNPKVQWRVDAAEQALVCSGEGGHEWLRYDRELTNFELHVDWRFTPRTSGETRYNSGVGVRLSRFGEIWHQAQTGPTGAWLFGSTVTDGALKGFNLMKEMKENRVKPTGEWNHFEIRAVGDKITLSVNGEVVNELTGVGLKRGYIGFEAEGYEVAFKNIRLKVLD
jgi:Domain of Unknown Function (DUF1080)